MKRSLLRRPRRRNARFLRSWRSRASRTQQTLHYMCSVRAKRISAYDGIVKPSRHALPDVKTFSNVVGHTTRSIIVGNTKCVLRAVQRYAEWSTSLWRNLTPCHKCHEWSWFEHRRRDQYYCDDRLPEDLELPDLTCDTSLRSLWLLARRNFALFLRCVRKCARLLAWERCNCEECNENRGGMADREYDECFNRRDYVQKTVYRNLAHFHTGSFGLLLCEILHRLARSNTTAMLFERHAEQLRELLRYLFASGNVMLALPFSLYAPREHVEIEVSAFVLRHQEQDRRKLQDFENREDRYDVDVNVYGERCVAALFHRDGLNMSESEFRWYFKAVFFQRQRCWSIPAILSTPTMIALHVICVFRTLSESILNTCKCVDMLSTCRWQVKHMLDRRFDRLTLRGSAMAVLFEHHGFLALARCRIRLQSNVYASFRNLARDLRNFCFVEYMLDESFLARAASNPAGPRRRLLQREHPPQIVQEKAPQKRGQNRRKA